MALKLLRKVLLLVAALALSQFVVVVVGSPAQAHCPSGSGHWYVSGGNGNNTVRSVQTRIGVLGSPDVCDSGTSYSITICHDDCAGWLQVGWRYYDGYANPKGYCERRPLPSTANSYALTEYPIDVSGQFFTYLRNSGSTSFECRIDGGLKRVTDQNWIGFGSGAWVPVQAEAHARHVQLGRVAPNWLIFSGAEKVETSATAWSSMNVNNVHSDDIVWGSVQPDPDGFKVNTSVPH